MLVSKAIELAYRESNIIVIGELPSDDENAEALSLLNDFRRSLFGYELGENYADWRIPAPNTQGITVPDGLVSPDLSATWYLSPLQNSHMLVKITAAGTVKFPLTPDPGARMKLTDMGSDAVELTLDGNGRKIEGQLTLIDDVQQFDGKEWFYRDDLASWELVEDLALTDELPLDPRFNDLFITYLAIRLAPRHSQEVTDDTRRAHDAVLKRAKARYRQEQGVAVADPRTSQSEQTYTNGARDWFV